ncbi:MAG: nuclear transport factor 2 family protein [Tenericutes bacterium]|nr:nuclear transport factor 2 family protein [Mycoplasmatota bacterium]
MTHKEISVKFLTMCITDQVEKAYDLFVHKDFIHHNQYVKKDRLSLLNAMMEDNQVHKDKKITILKQIEENNYVSNYSIVNIDDKTKYMVVHIFRFEDDQIIEAWDIGEEVIKDSANPIIDLK